MFEIYILRMNSQLWNRERLITFVVVIVGLICFLWMVCPSMNGASTVVSEATEGFNAEEEVVAMPQEEGPTSDGPYVNPNTGVVMDGPGFEEGDIEGAQETSPYTIPSNYYFLDDGAGGEMSIQHNLCSKSCCSEQWPTPHKQAYDPYVCQNKDQFVPSRIFCNTSFGDSGCACISKKQATFLANRGGNGREWF